MLVQIPVSPAREEVLVMKGRILIIDDEPRWIDFARSDLSKFEIVVAGTLRLPLLS